MMRRSLAIALVGSVILAAALASPARVHASDGVGLGPPDAGAVAPLLVLSAEKPIREELTRDGLARDGTARDGIGREEMGRDEIDHNGTASEVVGRGELANDGAARETTAREVQLLAAAEPAPIDAPVFRLAVPFRTQKDGSRWQGSNCGPAVLGMVLDGFGVGGQETDDLRFRAHTYQGTVGMRTGTALQHVARVAEDFGVAILGLYDAEDRFHTWTVEDVRAQLRLGRPVVPLVRLYLVPGYEGSLPRWGHYILLTGVAPDGFYLSDPLQPDAGSGAGRVIGDAQLERAMANSHIPGQAVAFRNPTGAMPAVWSPGP